MKLEFIKSATEPGHYPKYSVPEIVVAGRSNSGKSSFLNAVARRKIAKTSSTPGKTRTINFFSTNKRFGFVDLPGYGYAARSAGERRSWAKMIETFFSVRGNILGVLLLIDIRRKWHNDEQELVEFLSSLDIPVAVLLTKSDKLGRMQQQKAIRSMRQILDSDLVFAVSSQKGNGIHEVLQFCDTAWAEDQ